MIIAIVGLKGGSGKSTLAVHLAAAMASPATGGVLLIDADRQESAGDWLWDSTLPIKVEFMSHGSIHRKIGEVMQGLDHCIIDCPPRGDAVTISAIRAANVALIVSAPSPLDTWPAGDAVALLKELESQPKAAFVINRLGARSSFAQPIREALKVHGLPVLKTTVGNRVDFVRAANTATVVPEKSLAGQEIRALTKEVLLLGKQ